MSTNKLYKLDFLWSSQKEYFSLKYIYLEAKRYGFESRLIKVHKNIIRNFLKIKQLSDHIVISHDSPLKRIKKLGWNGKYIYIEHGLGAMKYYTYKYSFFHEADLLFYPGNIFKQKMEALNPNFKNGLLGGYPKMDELYHLKINRKSLSKKYHLNYKKPIILFAPSWGGKYSYNSGVNNIKYLKNIDNIITIPHPADYSVAKKYDVIIPKEDESINQFLHLADLVISDISSVLAEACLINKPVIQIILKKFSGCFPYKDKRNEEPWISKDIIENEMKNDFIKRPFKIPYIDKDWILGHTCYPVDLEKTIILALTESKKFETERIYWAKESCWKFDGNISKRILAMIKKFIDTGKPIQIESMK